MRSFKLLTAAALVAALVSGPVLAQDAVAPASDEASSVATEATSAAPAKAFGKNHVKKEKKAKKAKKAKKSHGKKMKGAAEESVTVVQ